MFIAIHSVRVPNNDANRTLPPLSPVVTLTLPPLPPLPAGSQSSPAPSASPVEYTPKVSEPGETPLRTPAILCLSSFSLLVAIEVSEDDSDSETIEYHNRYPNRKARRNTAELRSALKGVVSVGNGTMRSNSKEAKKMRKAEREKIRARRLQKKENLKRSSAKANNQDLDERPTKRKRSKKDPNAPKRPTGGKSPFDFSQLIW